jgi:hypothetical protein
LRHVTAPDEEGPQVTDAVAVAMTPHEIFGLDVK